MDTVNDFGHTNNLPKKIGSPCLKSHKTHSLKNSRNQRNNLRFTFENNLEGIEMAPFQTSVNIRQDNNENMGQNSTEVQIIPDDDNWAENTTAITGNTSDRSESLDGIDPWTNDLDEPFHSTCFRYLSPMLSGLIILSAFLSPIAMTILPKIGIYSNTLAELTIQQRLSVLSCNIECKGLVLGIAFKLSLLGIGTWAIFVRRRPSVMPRIFMYKIGVLVFTFLCICTFWMFYMVQLNEAAKSAIVGESTEYKNLVTYAGTLMDTLLFIHFTAVVLIEIRHLRPVFYIKIVRSPDGESRSYAIGELSIQRAALWVLEHYYTEFSIYNPYLERLPVSKSGKKQQNTNTSFKFYDVDNSLMGGLDQQNRANGFTDGSRAILAAQARRRDSSHNERFYEEHEYKRRVRKRKARLLTAAEEAFAHIRRLHSESQVPCDQNPLDNMEAAQAVFPSIARSLQKFLRITRQQPRHSVETILERLAQCLAQDVTPRAFLEPYFNTSPVLSNEKERQRKSQYWALVCEGDLPSRPITDGCEFQLRQGEIALLCTIQELPRFHITEQLALPKSNKFILKINSEISS